MLHDTFASYLADGSVRKVQLDTYEPELKRYGGLEGMALAERLFEADSDAVLALLKLLPGDEGLEQRWRVALCSIDALLMELIGEGPDSLEARQDVLADLLRGLEPEFRVDTALRKQIGERFRKERAWLEAQLSETQTPNSTPLQLVLYQRSQRLAPIITDLHASAGRGTLTHSLQSLTATYVHMHTNRLFRSAGRAQELVSYHLLTRWYTSSREMNFQKEDPRHAEPY